MTEIDTSDEANTEPDIDWSLTAQQLCDLELLTNGGFAPLTGFLDRADYESVLTDMRLASGTLWPMPIMLDVPENTARRLDKGQILGLRDAEGVLLATMTVGDIWQPDRHAEAEAIFGTDNVNHPGVARLLERTHPWYVGGRVELIQPPIHYDFPHLRHTPQELRMQFEKRGWERVIAFQTRNPMHRVHQELTFRAAREIEANLLIHPVVGLTQPNDVNHYTRVRCYEHILKRYPEQTTALSLLNLAMRMAGPREALWHALIRKNHGCTHLIVGRDHAGPRNPATGTGFYDPYAAQALIAEHEDEIGLQMVPFREMKYVESRAQYVPVDEIQPDDQVREISGTEVRRRLSEGLDIPEWFSYPEVVAELRRTHPPRARQGVTIFFTGLSGSGKSTLANALQVKLMELGGRQITLLDGDIVRKHLSSELGFSKEHRNLNIMRIGFVASEITKNGGIALCAPIAPYAATRREVRDMIEPHGGFIEIHVSTPLEVCEQRDRKGLYKKARQGIIKEFTGISDPYEEPENPELEIDTTELHPERAVQQILLKLEHLGYLTGESH
ncbi:MULTISPECIES: bifunctional sulfate adenylyltransferase/adenylylsulfate kinase [unclassified Wenzhouxiangella]|uniref:bifunctional sulfate adenylyltransferase/adenylylsulfate kinase n=1 Tax=unclassified Wenzhouxiangella TaxID=2613841 RepID=UPI000E32C6DA|nr:MULTISPECIES: bifunctional sulfate adenylyltransferase/adenylylsulfate kinase [unclassified Wenzhouxiangella]RFF27675.1 bifunctional sulfate adenylyltransferase/adenylylsulfate kinase [Wenzhouxiangella sp. 15181]RFP69767.1 bifunctional sulfate adenylyltransferase/adenylylsulfate kinase [Wenzhouxiangella sp. 15190]